jgi:acyl-coenzyme A thioesterase PaaI-like protein
MTDTAEPKIQEDALAKDIKNKSDLKTHKNIHTNHGYNILELSENYAKISIHTQKSETVGENNTVYDGTLFSAANFCAIAAVNQENLFLLGANVDFLNQVNGNDNDVIFEANAKSNASGKKNIDVKGTINDITIFQGVFTAIKLDSNSLIKQN